MSPREADAKLPLMSGSGPKRPAPYEDLLKVPENLIAELIDGEIVTSPRPAGRHAAASSILQSTVSAAFDRRGGGTPGGWVILFEPELHIVGQILVPDVAGWRHESMPVLPDAAFIEIAPDWVCEVLSPSTAALDRTRKIHHYARAGVSHLWFLDPQPETLEVFRLDGGSWRLVTSVAGPVRIAAEPLEAIEMDLARVWAR